jgi:hypothetical protein
MSTKYEKMILKNLIDKYENSKSFTGTNRVNQRFKIKIIDIFTKYNNHSEYKVFEEVNDTVEVLERKGFVKSILSGSRVVKEVYLQIEKLPDIYSYLNRTPKDELNKKLESILNNYSNKNNILSSYCKEQLFRLSENKSVKFYNGNIKEFESILISISKLMELEEETFIRKFSLEVLKDSKAFSKIQNKVEKILIDYGDDVIEEQVLSGFNLVRNPAYVNFKGSGIIKLAGQVIDLRELNGDIAISSKLLKDIEYIKVTGTTVITIENLTSFHSFNDRDYFVIYLGGFHNRIRRNFIRKLYKNNKDLSYKHFGDIDAGGFHILKHLREKTCVNFKPFMMDIETLKKYSGYTKKLTSNDKKRLKNLLDSEFKDVIKYMLENNCKLEQEVVI